MTAQIRPYLLFWSIALLSLLVSFFAGEKTVDINLHDTYFVISYVYIALFVAAVFGFTGLIYMVLNRIKRPVASGTGYWHLGSLVFGFLVLSAAFGISAVPSFVSLAPILLLMGLALLFVSMVIFVYGLASAFFRGNAEASGDTIA